MKQILESKLVVLDSPIDFHIIPNASVVKLENSILTLSIHFIHRAPSLNKSGEDVLTLIVDVKNHTANKDY